MGRPSLAAGRGGGVRELSLHLHDDEATRKQAATAGATAFLQAADSVLVDVLRRVVERARAVVDKVLDTLL
jgi:hypothetical protein